MAPLRPSRPAPQPPPIRPRWDTAFQYAGKAAPREDGTVPKVPARPEDVRSVDGMGRPLAGQPQFERSVTGRIDSGAQRPTRDAEMDPQVAERLHGSGFPTVRSEATQAYDILGHHTANSGSSIVMNHLPIRPHGTHVPDPHLEAAANGFRARVNRADAEGDPSIGAPKGTAVKEGEFEALIRKAPPDRPPAEQSVETFAYQFGPSGGSLDRVTDLGSDFRLHSHPFDPADTRNQVSKFPSGGDYLAASLRDMQTEAGVRGNRADIVPQRSVLLHDQDLFLFPGESGRLTFDRIGPAGSGPSRPRPGEDRDRYATFAHDPKPPAPPDPKAKKPKLNA